MKKFIILCVTCILLYLIGDYLYYNQGFYIPQLNLKEVDTFVKTEGKEIYIKNQGDFEQFEIKGINMGAGIPGHFATDYAISKEDYLRWFKMIQDMGANTIRVYTILSDDFYEAVYEYNQDNENPLYIMHGLGISDYVQNSHMDAYAPEFIDNFIEDGKDLIDVIHGKKKLSLGKGLGSGFYKRDISPWVIGYILGVEWEDVTVAYTNQMQEDKRQYKGKYMSTTVNASSFEAMLARVGDELIAYESKRYGQQRLIAFSNWATTDPFTYSEAIKDHFNKIAQIDVEHIQINPDFKAGMFASYHVYPYYPDYLSYETNKEAYKDEKGQVNTYRAYLEKINEHHTIPVVISEFGIPSSRGMSNKRQYNDRNKGKMSENDQAKALVDCYKDIKASGCAGAIVYSWQDEWFKHTWNTMHAVNLQKTPYWSDYQTNAQSFGLLAFDPGEKESICYVDGDLSEWTEQDRIIKEENLELSIKYDEKFIYLLAYKKGLNESDQLYIPVDTTPKSGSMYDEESDMKFDRNVDFIIEINGKDNSRVWVQERYEVLRAMFAKETQGINAYERPPHKDSSLFKPINLILRDVDLVGNLGKKGPKRAETYETGALIHGVANPRAANYNSLADFCFSGDFVEIKLPWQLLNFSNPSEMMIHDDYYEHYGVEEIQISEMYLGIGIKGLERPIQMQVVDLEPWYSKVTYHERLKPAYFAMQTLWQEGDK